jgi:hypothetical protein
MPSNDVTQVAMRKIIFRHESQRSSRVRPVEPRCAAGYGQSRRRRFPANMPWWQGLSPRTGQLEPVLACWSASSVMSVVWLDGGGLSRTGAPKLVKVMVSATVPVPLAPQHGDLVPQHEQLGVLGGRRPAE